MITPLDLYQQQLAAGIITADPQQQEVIQLLQKIYINLLKKNRNPLHKFFYKKIPGLYLWGSVGVGKTFLMDLFYHCLPIKKMRSHFHEFMQMIQLQLKALQGTQNPLDQIAKNIAQKTQVLCFDEFMVDDIADAMILANLFTALFAHGICVIASSNTEPDHLYANGLQRELFLPAIALIKKQMQVFHMIAHHDYRLTAAHSAGIYFTPLNEQAELNLEKCFRHFAQNTPVSTDNIILFDREITIRKRAGSTIWFDFAVLCGIPRSSQDYLALAKQYKTVLISHVPVIQPHQHHLITALINLIDIFYDAHVRVIIAAAAPIEALYPEGKLRFAFARTQSRLIEMQSVNYFACS